MNTVNSADGTAIAYETTGAGPALVLIGTTASDRHGLDTLAGELSRHYTVHNYDRRGRGDSGDTQPYEPRREVADIEALIDAVGGSAYLASGSAGTVLALDAATALGAKVTGLYLYEVPFIVDDSRPPVPADYVAHLDELVRAGRRSEAVEYLMVEAVGVPPEYIDAMKADPSWEVMTRYAHTISYDGRILAGTQDGRPLPADRWTHATRTVAVVGANSPEFFHAGAKQLVDLLPNAEFLVLPDQDHSAFWMAPQVIADHIHQVL
ncbi:alpha/beta fold hydrolase [Plantactinospora sp. GCM10030261]|uniref:alpha/beta fold hydrolase n=1 Tax=Plantactinospora sp. GCM10030261 TaxID=3273420 RepID=UPI00361227D6